MRLRSMSFRWQAAILPFGIGVFVGMFIVDSFTKPVSQRRIHQIEEVKVNVNPIASLLDHSYTFVPSYSLCRDPLIELFNKTEIVFAADLAWRFFANLHSELASRLDDPKKFTRANPYAHFDMLGPVGPTCSELVRVGGTRGHTDNEKHICGLRLKDNSNWQDVSEDCVIYSIGGHGEWSFEEGDYPVPKAIASRVFIHKVCIGPRDEGLFLSWPSIVELVGDNKPPTHLKMDIEGWEYSVLSSIVESGIMLPQQISVELHWYTGGVGNSNWGNRPLPELMKNAHRFAVSEDFGYMQPYADPPTYSYKTPGEMAAFMQMLFLRGGYMLIDRRDNADCRHCTEIVLARLLCPPGRDLRPAAAAAAAAAAGSAHSERVER